MSDYKAWSVGDHAIVLIPSVQSGGVQCRDPGVDHRFLTTVDVSGRRPFRDSVGVDAAGPAAGMKIVVVKNAKQSQIIQIRFATLKSRE